MVNGKHTLTTKVLAMLLSVVMLISLIPAGAISVSAATPDKMGTLSCITANGTVTDAEGAEAKATYGNLSLNWYKKDPSVYRYNDGWWVGIKMTAPADMLTAEDFTDVTYQRCVSLADDTWTAATPFWNVQDSDINVESTERFLTLWGMVNEQFINEALLRGTTINYTWRFDWNADGTYEQVATLEINPEDMVLTKDGAQVYPATDNSGTVAPISQGLALQTDATANIVRVSYTADTVLNWVKADPSITRFNDGWWAGIKMTAPADMLTAADFENVTYQNKSGNVWSEAKNFWNAQDSDKNAESTQRFIGLWGLLNEDFLTRANGGKFEYHWRFDWDGDGYYEQIVILEIDSSKITLLDETGVQVYPELGKVTTLTGGTVVGSGTGKTVVTAENLSLQWHPKNEAIGRMEDGWWAGIQITAPASAVITKDSDVNYKSKIGDADWSAVKSFYNNQDSAKDGTVHYMQMWTRLDATRVTAAIEAGKDITTQWQFDWDKDGKYEQTVTFNIDPETVILNKVQVTDFSFTETATDKTVWYGTGFIDVKAWSDTSDGVVTYALDVDESVATLEVKDNTATVVFNKDLDVGDDGVFVTVTATLAETDVYAGATKTFTFKIVKQEVTGFSISNPAPIKRYYEGGELLPKQFDNVATDNIGGGIIKYKVTSGNDVAEFAVIDADGYSDSSALTIKKAGKVTVTAYRLADQKYKQAFAEYTLTIDPADQNAGFASDQSAIDYSFLDRYDPAEEFAVTGQKTKGKITYAIVETGDDAVAEMENGKIKTKKIGTFTLTATVPGDDNHNEQILTKTVTINRGKRTTAKLEQQGPITVVYNDNNNEFVNKLFTDDTELGRDEADTVTYKLFAQEAISDGDIAPTDDAPVVTVDPTSPELKINRSGKVTIKATIAENDKYEAFSVEYVLTIEKAKQAFTLKNGTEIGRNYGIVEYEFITGNEPVPVEVPELADKGVGTGKYVFELVGENNINATFDDTKIYFGDSEKKCEDLTVKVTKVADVCYEACSAKYTLSITRLVATVSYADLIYNKKLNANLWYDGDVTIAPPAPQNDLDYFIAFDDELSTDYTDSVTYDKPGTFAELERNPYVYLRRKSDGAITTAIYIENYKMDKTEPSKLSIKYDDDTVWYNFVQVVTGIFGFKNTDIGVTLTAEDDGSGIDYFEYSTDGGATFTKEEFARDPKKPAFGQTKIEHKIAVSAEHRNGIVFRATNLAGKTTENYADDKTLVIDTVSPTIDVKYEYATNDHEEAGDIYYTQGDVNVAFIIEDSNVDLAFGKIETETDAPRPIVKVNGTEIPADQLAWNPIDNTNKWTGNFDLKGEGDYVVTLSFEDRSGNPAKFGDTEGFEQEIRIDGTASTIAPYEFSGTSVDDCEVAHNNATAVRFYYNEAQELTLKVTEHNFDPSQVDLTVVAKNLAGNDIDISSKKYADFAKTAGNWKSVGDEHTLVFADAELFDIDANYTLSLTVTDYAGNSTTDEDELFTVDTLANDQPEQPTIKFEAASLGEIILDKLTFGFFNAPLTVTVTSSDVISGLKYINYYYKGAKGEYDATEVKIDPVDKKVDDDGITISFEIPEKTEFKGIVSATAKDWATNESVKQEVGYDTKNTELKGIFLDNIAPQIGVTYTPAEKSAEEEPTVVTYYKNDVKTNNFVDATQAYYNGAVNATITITENNFFEGLKSGENYVHQVGILVTKTDNIGNVTKTEYLPAEKAAKMFIEEPAENVTWTTASITWTHKDNVHSFTIPYEDDADYKIEIIYTDFALNHSKITADDLAENDVKIRSYVSKPVTVDTTAPVFSEYTFTPGEIKGTQGERNYYNVAQKVSVTVTEHNFDPSQVELTVIAKNVDNKKDIDISVKNYSEYATKSENWIQNGNEYTLEFTDDADFDIEANYTLSLKATDRATNSTDAEDELFTVDGTEPEIRIDYDQPSLAQIVLETLTFGFFNSSVNVTVTASDAIAGVEYVDYAYEGSIGHYDATAVGDTKNNQKLDKDGKISFKIDPNFKGTVTATAYDWADNSKRADVGCDKPEEDKTEGNKLDGIILDNDPPKIQIDYHADENNEGSTTVGYFDENLIKVDSFAKGDRAFYNNNAAATIKIKENNFFEGLKQGENYVHQVGILVTKTDEENNDPVTTEYLPAQQAAKMFEEADEIKTIEWETSEEEPNVHFVTIPYVGDGDYVITVKYTDFGKNEAEITAGDFDGKEIDGDYTSKVVTVDTTAPVINITYPAAPKAEDKEATKIHYVDQNLNDVSVASFKEDATKQAFYNGKVNTTIKITEHNFFEGQLHQVGILVTKTDDEGKVTKTEYRPEGTANIFEKDTTDTNVNWAYANIIWDHKGNDHTFVIPYEQDGDYEIELIYTDIATNAAEIYADDIKDGDEKKDGKYTSKIVTVDTTYPVVTVEYDNKDVAAKYATDNGIREYFTAAQTATVTVKEHNFRADDFAAVVTALYSDMVSEVPIADIAAQMKKRENWKNRVNEDGTTEKNVYEIKLDFSVEANYTFDYTYNDLAQNAADGYAVDEFTVDKTDPENLTITYAEGAKNKGIFDTILNAITFGYYDSKVTVTITADDEVSGIDHFVYSYINAKGVSKVNASLKNVEIGAEDITQEGETFIAEFEIPRSALQNNNQFSGKVNFTAVDRSTRDTDHNEKEAIVVDNIAPKATVTFNDPVQTVQGNPIVSYYKGNIDATIVINEANFHSEEVAVLVNGEPVKVKWVDNSVDIHTGTFTLSEEGDYIVTVDYTDRSGNVMEHYESHQLTIDVTNPVINVSGVKHNSANNGETITFTVSVTDKNIPLDGFKPVLQVYTQKPGKDKNTFVYKLESVALGTPATSTNAAGETVYSYTISNLKLDGYYTLTCTAKDYADHTVSEISAQSNQGGTVSTTKINYTVNREGSVFWIETEHNDKYSSEPETMLKNKLNGAYANDKVVVRLFERNVDTVDGDAENKTALTLNDGSSSEDIPLVEKENYTKNTNVATDAGQIWYENVYTLNNEIFDHDGVYSVNAITYDRATNSNVNTQHEAAVISFTLDRTSPAISSNIKNNQRINDTEFWVEFGITETNLDPETIVVKITDNNGETVEKKLSDLDDLGNNEYKFLVESGYNYTVEIVAKDAAGNTSELYKVEHLTISTNIFILWYANTPLFWGSIGGTILLAGLIVLLIFLKKKKKKENN